MMSKPTTLTRKDVKDVKSLGDAAEYYADAIDDYYTKEGDPSAWQGKGAAELGLSGPVDEARFRELLESRITPGGPRMRGGAPGDAKERLAIDVTLSPPKSVSIQALIGGDAEVIRAHDRAVTKTVEVIESFAETRDKTGGKSRVERTGNLIVAKFRHETNRENEPQLHTHAVIMNLTRRSDGQWRALKNDKIYDMRTYFTAVYRAELAHELKQLGFQIRHEREGAFELAHISRAQVKAFSTRTEDINAVLAEKGLTRETASGREKERIALETRAKKVATDRNVLHAKWSALARELGIRFDGRGWTGPGAGQDIGARGPTPASVAARNAVRDAIKHLTERQSIMNSSELTRTAMQNAVGHARLHDIHAEMAAQIRTGFLIRETPLYRPAGDKDTDATGKSLQGWIADLEGRDLDRKDARSRVEQAIRQGGLVVVEVRYTTQTALEREKRTLAIERDGRGAMTPILPAEAAKARLAPASLDAGQRDAAEMILSTANRVVGVQGLAGTGKSHMLQSAKAAIEETGFEMRALAPYGNQVKALRELNVPSATLASFLKAKDKNIGPKTVLVVDEAGVVPARLMEQTLRIAEKAGARVVLVGDIAQTKAIEAGRPFDQLQAAGMATARMTEIRRQRNAELKRAVEFAAQGDTRTSLGHIPDVTEIKDDRDRRTAVADAFVKLKAEERDGTLIVSGTNEARRAINSRIREGLGLVGKGVEFDTLIRRDTTQQERKYSRNYRVGDVIQPEKDYPKAGLARGETYAVLDTGPGNRLTVRSERDGAITSFSPAAQQKLSVYEPRRAELTVGDVVRVTRNDASLDLANGDRFKVAAVEAGRVTLADGRRRVALATNKPLHLDHAYATTVHSAQGLTADRVLIDADSKSRTTTREVYYVAISRSRDGAQIFTDDKSKLPAAIARNTEKYAALDLARGKGGGPRDLSGAEIRERNDSADRPAHESGDSLAARERQTKSLEQSARANAQARQQPEERERETER